MESGNNKVPNALFPHGRILMCCPDYYNVNYEINPWMNKNLQPDNKTAWRQWKELHHTILRLGAWVEYIKQSSDQPDLVFTANGGLVKNNKCILANFRYPERHPERPAFKKWFTEKGFDVYELKDSCFEGEGDALFAGDKLFISDGYRTDESSHQQIADILNLKKVIRCKLKDPYFYHLDTCFCPLDEDTAVFYAGAFTDDSIKEMRKNILLIDIREEEARRFAANCVVLGRNIIIPSGCTKLCNVLNKKGFTTHEIELDQFIKAGGAAKCLTLHLSR